MAKDSESISPKRARTREKLIDAAAEIIAQKGFQGATLDEVAAKAGLTKGAIYDNFNSKDELFFAVVMAKPQRLPLPDKPAGGAKAKMAAMAEAAIADGENARLQIPLRAEFLLYTLSHQEMSQRVAPWMKAGFAAERDRVMQVFSKDELPMSPDAFVLMLQAMIPGLMYLRSQSAELVSDDLIREIFEGLAPKG